MLQKWNEHFKIDIFRYFPINVDKKIGWMNRTVENKFVFLLKKKKQNFSLMCAFIEYHTTHTVRNRFEVKRGKYWEIKIFESYSIYTPFSRFYLMTHYSHCRINKFKAHLVFSFVSICVTKALIFAHCELQLANDVWYWMLVNKFIRSPAFLKHTIFLLSSTSCSTSI